MASIFTNRYDSKNESMSDADTPSEDDYDDNIDSRDHDVCLVYLLLGVYLSIMRCAKKLKTQLFGGILYYK